MVLSDVRDGETAFSKILGEDGRLIECLTTLHFNGYHPRKAISPVAASVRHSYRDHDPLAGALTRRGNAS